MLFLQPDELSVLTGKVRANAQILALRRMGIEHRVRPDGKPLVLRSHIDPATGEPRSKPKTQPRYETINATRTTKHQPGIS